MISVVCRTSHPKDVTWNVATFTDEDTEMSLTGTVAWSQVEFLNRDGTTGTQAGQSISGLQPTERAMLAGVHGPTRGRYDLVCTYCGLKLTMHEERLAEALDKLAGAGVSRVDLSALVATLT